MILVMDRNTRCDADADLMQDAVRRELLTVRARYVRLVAHEYAAWQQ
jgi:hypothetical protein